MCIDESRSLGFERKHAGNFHLKLNMGLKPIENKYHEGNVKRTLERKLKVLEIAEEEAGAFEFQGLRLLHDANVLVSCFPVCMMQVYFATVHCCLIFVRLIFTSVQTL